MLLMDTSLRRLPMYGTSGEIFGERVTPVAIGRFQNETVKPDKRELAFFVPQKVEPSGYDELYLPIAWPSLFVMSAADLLRNGHEDCFLDPEGARRETEGEPLFFRRGLLTKRRENQTNAKIIQLSERFKT